MTDKLFSNDIFFEPQSSQQANEEASFLNISQLLDPYPNNFNIVTPMEESPIYEVSAHDETRFQKIEEVPLNSELTSKQQNLKPIYKSSLNKNACFNICQKTIKTIKKGTYDSKLSEFLEQFGVEDEEFKNKIYAQKKNFTGPKALTQYISKKSPESQVFSAFMKWFLTNKYLRIALNEGEMKNIKAYIEYKNLVILPILD